jgi:hypothetical protein
VVFLSYDPPYLNALSTFVCRRVGFCMFCFLPIVVDDMKRPPPETFLGRTMDEWLSELRDTNALEEDRDAAVDAMGAFGPAARDAAPLIRARFEQATRHFERRAALNALASVEANDPETVRLLEDILGGTRRSPIEGWSAVEREAAQAVTHLANAGCLSKAQARGLSEKLCLLVEKPERIAVARPKALEALGALKVAGGDVVRVLVAALDDPPCAVLAMTALGELGDASEPVTTALQRSLKHEFLSSYAAVALWRIGVPELRKVAERHLDAELSHVSFSRRRNGACAMMRDPVILREILAHSKSKLTEKLTAVLKEMLAGREPLYREGAAIGLAHLGVMDDAMTPVLRSMLRHELEMVRSSAAQAAGALGSKASPLRPALEQCRADDTISVRVRNEAAEALKRLRDKK